MNQKNLFKQFGFIIMRVSMIVTFAFFSSGLSVMALESVKTDTLDKLRINGSIGELENGYIEARDTTVQKIVEVVNESRRTIYIKKAKENNTSAEAVGLIYAIEIRKSVPPGTWIQTNGSWIQKD